ncbi:MAG: hypothetical protein RR500_03995 [Bacilli bacterium]
MLSYVKKDEYLKLTGAESVPASFAKLVIEASNYINVQTFGRVDPNNIQEQVKYVTCLIIDLIYRRNKELEEIGTLKSQSIEGWSEAYATPDEIRNKYENEMCGTLKIYLSGVTAADGQSLLYRGV